MYATDPESPAQDKVYKEALAECDLLREEYIRLQTDKEVLLGFSKGHLEALYSVRIGKYQLQLLEAQARLAVLKRTVELIQARLNRGEPADLAAIEKQVQQEIHGQIAVIRKQAAQIEQAQEFLTVILSPTDNSELRKLYRELARWLHPDLNPELTPEQEEWWLAVRRAYEQKDVKSLKALKIVVEGSLGQREVTLDELLTFKQSLKEGISLLMGELHQIRSQFPFTMEKQIKDDAWVAAEQERLQAEIAAVEEQAAHYTERLELLKSVIC